MSTNDVFERSQVCPCGSGQIKITESSPDHPYARISQTVYRGGIICSKCSIDYALDDVEIDGERYIVLQPNDKNMESVKVQLIDLFSGGLIK